MLDGRCSLETPTLKFPVGRCIVEDAGRCMIEDARKEVLQEGAGREVHAWRRCQEGGAGRELPSGWCQERGACRVEGARREVHAGWKVPGQRCWAEGAGRCRIGDAVREVHSWKIPEGE